MKQRLGFMYIARRPCGKVSAAAWDDPGREKSTGKSVAEWITRGDAVTRVERKEDDPQPEWVCSRTDPNCTCIAGLKGFGMLKGKNAFGDDALKFQRDMREEWNDENDS